MGKSLQGKELGEHISQRKDGRYQGSFVDRFGKRRYCYSKNLAELKKKLRAAQVENDSLTNIIQSDMTVDEWFDMWMDTYRADCRNTTKHQYEYEYKRVKKNLGNVKLSELQVLHVQRAINQLKTVSSKKNTLKILRSMLRKAVDSDLLLKNPADRVEISQRIKHKERRVLTKKETVLLLEAMEGKTHYPLIVVALGTGMRIGELLGLTWDNIDFKNERIHVQQTLCFVENENGKYFEMHEPKTEKGNRSIPMLPDVKKALKQQYEIKQNILKQGHEPQAGFENLVFTTRDNNPVHAMGVRLALEQAVGRIRKKYPTLQFDDVYPHALRHTFATRCIENGIEPKSLQIILGHSTIGITMDLYCHVMPETIDLEMQKLENMQIALTS